MQYELYIDVFFLVNFMMDLILLLLLNQILACTATQGRIIFGAFTGAALTCLVVCLPFPSKVLKMLFFHGFVNIAMLKTGLKIRWDRTLVKALVFLYIGAFLIGGIMTAFRQYLRTGSLFFVLSLSGYYFAKGIFQLMESLCRQNSSQCKVCLYCGKNCCQKNALIDTGNRLTDPVSKKAVSIISQRAADLMFLQEPIRYISYHSVGNPCGVLPVYELDKICLKGRKKRQQKETEVLKPLVAVWNAEMEKDGYDVILNPDIFENFSI